MRFRTLAMCLLLACAVHAQESDDDSKRAARIEFERGMALSEQGKYVDALAAFQKSRARYPTRTNTQNLALTMERLGRFTDALEMLERLEKEFPDLTPEQRTAIDDKKREIRQNVGTLTIVAPEGAQVEVDGRVLGTAPLFGPILLNPGRHEVKLTKAGVGFAKTSVNVGAQQILTIEPKLEPPPAPPTRPKAKPAPVTTAQKELPPTQLRLGISLAGAWRVKQSDSRTRLQGLLGEEGLGLMFDFSYGSRAFVGAHASGALLSTVCDSAPASCAATEYRLGALGGWRWRVHADVKGMLAAHVGAEHLVVTNEPDGQEPVTERDSGWNFGPLVSVDFALSRAFHMGFIAMYSMGYYPARGDAFHYAHTAIHFGLRGEIGW